MILNIVIAGALAITVLVLLLPALRRSKTWKAMTTPLASIIGSGFLVLGPILDISYGKYAPLVMAGLCLVAYSYGTAIRYNIAALGSEPPSDRITDGMESIASWALGFAYIISVAYYLNLFGAFGVSLTDLNTPFLAKMLTSTVFVIILLVGFFRGFKSLELMEYVSVTTKLAIIAGLLAGLAVFFLNKAGTGSLIFNSPEKTGWGAVTLAFGLIITVQGFETSRYLSANYDAATRIRSMRWAQIFSSVIYLIYIALIAYVFKRSELKMTETAIVDMMSIVSSLLPPLLVAAALAAQFSAAVADTSGSGGLIHEQSNKKIKPKYAYALVVAIGILLTWTTDLFQIINYASRTFAVYYALQSAIAARHAYRSKHWTKLGFFSLLTLLAVLITLFGTSVEGSASGN